MIPIPKLLNYGGGGDKRSMSCLKVDRACRVKEMRNSTICLTIFRQTHTFAQGEKNEEKSKSYRGKHALFAATVLHLKMFLFKVNAWGGGS